MNISPPVDEHDGRLHAPLNYPHASRPHLLRHVGSPALYTHDTRVKNNNALKTVAAAAAATTTITTL